MQRLILYLTTSVLFASLLFGCRPEQQASEFNISSTPKIGEGIELETKMNQAIEVNYFFKDDEAINFELNIGADPKYGKLSDCYFNNNNLKCMYTPNDQFVGTDEFYIMSRDGDFSSNDMARVQVKVINPDKCGDTLHGQLIYRTMFKDAVVNYGEVCESEVQESQCFDGELTEYSGSFQNASCRVGEPNSCEGALHGETKTRIKYKKEKVLYNEVCEKEVQSQTCNDGSFSAWSGSYTFDSCSIDAKEVIKKCEDPEMMNKLIEKKFTINFPAAIECQFNETGTNENDLNEYLNGPRKNEKIRARIEQYTKITLPENGVICDMKFQFPNQKMLYDDEILLTVNNYVVMSSQNYSTQSGNAKYANGLKINADGLMEYNWMGDNGLYNLYYGTSVTPKYCLGLTNQDANYHERCSIPKTETRGEIKLDIPANEMIKVGLGAEIGSNSNKKQISFGFITTGDNDNGDCEHAAYGFDVDIKYLEN